MVRGAREEPSPSSTQLGPVSVPWLSRKQDMVRRGNEALSHWVNAGALAPSPVHPTATSRLSRSGFALYFHSLLISLLKRMVVGLLLAALSLKDLVPRHNSPLCLNILSSR